MLTLLPENGAGRWRFALDHRKEIVKIAVYMASVPASFSPLLPREQFWIGRVFKLMAFVLGRQLFIQRIDHSSSLSIEALPIAGIVVYPLDPRGAQP